MAGLPESSTWEPEVYQLEVTDQALGGAGGKANQQATELGNRTKYLKDDLDDHKSNGHADQLDTGILRALNKIVLRTQSTVDHVRAILKGVATGASRGGFRIFAFDEAEAEASETPDNAHALFGGERNDAGDGTDFYLGGPGGIDTGLTSGQTVDVYIGGGTDWLLRATYDGTRRLLQILSPTLAERLALYADGRLLLARTGDPLAPSLTVTRRLPLLGGAARDSVTFALRDTDLTFDKGLTISSGGSNDTEYFIPVPESFDADGVVLQLATVQVKALAQAVSGGGSAVLRVTSDLLGTPAEADASNTESWSPGDALPKTLTATHTPSVDEALYLKVTVPNAVSWLKVYEVTATYKAHRLPL